MDEGTTRKTCFGGESSASSILPSVVGSSHRPMCLHEHSVHWNGLRSIHRGHCQAILVSAFVSSVAQSGVSPLKSLHTSRLELLLSLAASLEC